MKKRVRRVRKHRIQNPLTRPLVVYELWPFKNLGGKQLWSVGGASGAVHVSVVDERKAAALERARLLLGAPLAAWKRAIKKHEAAQKRSLLAAKRSRKRPRLERQYPARGKLKTGALVIVWDKTQAKADAQLRAALKGLGGGRKIAAHPRGGLLRFRRRKK